MNGDEDALSLARVLCNGTVLEVWTGKRLVGRVV